ncbi:hypothetical protein EON82_05480 [bacterium]|nr:MAG: hypothetical protein EON82_05480 [bacterium]
MNGDRPTTLAETMLQIRQARPLLGRPLRADLPLTEGAYLVLTRETPLSRIFCVRLLVPEDGRMVYRTPKVEVEPGAWDKAVAGYAILDAGALTLRCPAGRLIVSTKAKAYYSGEQELASLTQRFFGPKGGS